MTHTDPHVRAVRAHRLAVVQKRVADIAAIIILVTLVALVVTGGWWIIAWLMENMP